MARQNLQMCLCWPRTWGGLPGQGVQRGSLTGGKGFQVSSFSAELSKPGSRSPMERGGRTHEPDQRGGPLQKATLTKAPFSVFQCSAHNRDQPGESTGEWKQLTLEVKELRGRSTLMPFFFTKCSCEFLLYYTIRKLATRINKLADSDGERLWVWVWSLKCEWLSSCKCLCPPKSSTHHPRPKWRQ